MKSPRLSRYLAWVRSVSNNMDKNIPIKKGFTLVEIMVATTIFTIVMLIGMGALVTSSNTAKKAKAMRTAMDNVSFAMESMTRSLRMGKDYSCGGATGGDCPNGGDSIAFTPADNPPGSHPAGSRDTSYQINGSTLVRCGATGCIDMTSEDVDISYLQFYVNGSDPLDLIQPSVYIVIKGSVTIRGEESKFAIQTMTSQRSAEY